MATVDRRRALLERIAFAPTTSESAQLQQARALAALLPLTANEPDEHERVIVALEVIADGQPTTTRGVEAADAALTALESLELTDEPVEIASREPSRFFSLDLLWDLAALRGWRIPLREWRDGSHRIHSLQMEARRILAAPNPAHELEQLRALYKR